MARDILNCANYKLQNIIEKSVFLSQLNAQIKPLLPAQLRDECQVANFERNQLTLLTHNSAVATKLRYLTPDLLTHLRAQNLPQLATIKCLVTPKLGEKRPPAPTHRPSPSALSREGLKEQAKQTKNERLRDVLMRLSER